MSVPLRLGLIWRLPNIRVLTVPKGQPAPANAMAADEVIKFIGTRAKQIASIAAAAFN
jgi:hypothetical protein